LGISSGLSVSSLNNSFKRLFYDGRRHRLKRKKNTDLVNMKDIKKVILVVIAPIVIHYFFKILIRGSFDYELERNFNVVVTEKPERNNYNKGFYEYPCLDLEETKHSITISGKTLYEIILPNDTLVKKKEDSCFYIKRKHLVLKLSIGDGAIIDTVKKRY
jgi:hypothetical protein